jgi:RND family efflux transporter MFP subunit
VFDSIHLPPRCLALAIASFLAIAGCGTSHDDQAAQNKAAPAKLPTIAAEVIAVQPVSWPQTVRAQGTLVADEVVIVGSKIAGRAEEVNVDLGDHVVANAVLATLNQEEFQLQIILAEAQLVQARAALGLQADDPVEKLNPQNAPPVREAKAVLDEARLRSERIQTLWARNAVTQAELDSALGAEQVAAARLTSANNGVLEKIAHVRVRTAELQLAKQRLVDAVIHAPFEGIVQQRHIAPGSYVQVGDPIVTLVRTSTLRFQGTLPERHAVRLALGQQVRLSIESLPQPRIAKITRISPVIAAQSRSLMFEAALDNRDGALQTGLFAEAEVVVDPTSQVVAIPPGAIIEFAGAEKVWKIVDGVAQEQLVETARRGDSAVEISGGLSPGDVILYDAAQGKIARIEPTSTSVVAKPVVFVGGEDGAPADVNADPSQVKEASDSSAAE